jgi:hypothetical protein
MRDVGELERVLPPLKMSQRGVEFVREIARNWRVQEEAERCAELRPPPETLSSARVAQNSRSTFEIVQQYLLVTVVQNLFENLSPDFARYDRGVAKRIQKT